MTVAYVHLLIVGLNNYLLLRKYRARLAATSGDRWCWYRAIHRDTSTRARHGVSTPHKAEALLGGALPAGDVAPAN
jgi:hypothetical protein